MVRFGGQFEHTLDSKSRLTINSRLRDILGKTAYEGFRLVLGVNRVLELWPAESFERHVNRLRPPARSGQDLITFRRMLFHNAPRLEADRQGRVLLPERLLKAAGLKKDSSLILAGMDDHIELWDAGRFEEFQNDSMALYQQMLIDEAEVQLQRDARETDAPQAGQEELADAPL